MPAKRKLPPAPTGWEANDLEWAHASLIAPQMLEALPTDEDAAWGGRPGALVLMALRLRRDEQQRELVRTPARSVLRRLRLREARWLEGAFADAAWRMTGALAVKIQRKYPKASAGQVFMQIPQEMRPLLRAALEELVPLEDSAERGSDQGCSDRN